MAAIAYVTDEKMLEYFRIHGIGSVVFWRLSSKNFSDFKPGDLLFFLSKDSSVRKSREKGIVGYGCYTARNSLSIDTVWKKFGHKTGYHSKDEFIQAIEKSSKSQQLPKKIDCLSLEKVMFFQSPIYLSELGYQISNRLESFTYLDQNEGKQTLRILQEAKNIGLDSWSAMLGNGDEKIFGQQLVKYQIATVLEEMGIENKVRKAEEIFHCYADEDTDWLNQKKYAFIKQEPYKHIYYIFDGHGSNDKEKYYRTIGQLLYLKRELTNIFKEKIDFTLISETELSESQSKLIKEIGIEYQYYSQE